MRELTISKTFRKSYSNERGHHPLDRQARYEHEGDKNLLDI
jgi:hypothetical protein